MCCGNPSPHTGLYKEKCHAHIPTRLVGCWDRGPLGCCGNPSPLVGNSRENINIHILSLTYACTHSPFSSYCFFPVVAGRNSPAKFIKDMKSTPSQHAAPCNGNGGYPLPTRARIATGDKYPGSGDGPNPQRHSLPLKTPPTHSVTGQRHPLQFILEYLYCRGRPLPLGLSPRRM